MLILVPKPLSPQTSKTQKGTGADIKNLGGHPPQMVPPACPPTIYPGLVLLSFPREIGIIALP